jgi:hypothetical protein
MNSQKLCLKLFLKDPAQLHGVKLVPVFQSWIQLHAVEDHLAIDVADYEHVPDGPGTVLVTHEANFALDSIGGRPGLLYQRKQPLPGTFGERLAPIFRATLQAAARLQENPGLAFRTDELSFRIADRLLAPNTPETFATIKPELEGFLRNVLGWTTFQLEHKPDPRRLFEVAIKTGTSANIADLLARLETPVSAYWGGRGSARAVFGRRVTL